MPYSVGTRLPGEKASKLGHLDVIKSDLVNTLVDQFETNKNPEIDIKKQNWQKIETTEEPLRLIFAVDGSLQVVRSDFFPHKELAFVKTALLRLDQVALSKLDQEAPHPLALRDMLSETAFYHATVFPLKNISLPGVNNYHAIRKIVYDSVRDQSLEGEAFETLKWLAYEKWTEEKRKSPSFQCPHCEEEISGLDYDTGEGTCEHCKGQIFLTDMLGFHLDMAEDAAPQVVASAYMLIHETLMLFTGIRHYWINQRTLLQNCLFIKDGPLTLFGQYSKLVIPIRKLFSFARENKINLHVFGQEKTGSFVNHLSLIGRFAPEGAYFLPTNQYIRTEVQYASDRKEPYGLRTNYGNKLFVKLNSHHHVVLSVPTGEYKDSSNITDLIGIGKILATIPSIISHKHEGAFLPIELANGLASLSTYPSARILKIFAGID